MVYQARSGQNNAPQYRGDDLPHQTKMEVLVLDHVTQVTSSLKGQLKVFYLALLFCKHVVNEMNIG